jgi:cytochrome c oxidase assembly protein subunit 15
VALAAVTSAWWHSRAAVGDRSAVRLQRPAWVALGLALAQLVLGAHLRHLPANWSPSMFRGLAVVHLLVAAMLFVQVVWLTLRCWRDAESRRLPLLWKPATAISLLVALQIGLGIATWMVKYSWPTWLPRPATFRSFTVQAESMTQAVTVTAHVAVGSLVLATALLLALRAARLAQLVPSSEMLSGARRTWEALV